MRRALRWTPLLAVPLVVACAEPDDAAMSEVAEPAAEQPASDPADVRARIEAANREFAALLNQGDVAGFTGIYTDDAVIYPPEMEAIRGREVITAFWQGGQEQMGISNLRLTTEEVEVMDDTAWEVGTGTFDTNQGSVSAKYLVIWKRTPDGWRWHRDIWNMNPAQGA